MQLAYVGMRINHYSCRLGAQTQQRNLTFGMYKPSYQGPSVHVYAQLMQAHSYMSEHGYSKASLKHVTRYPRGGDSQVQHCLA